MEQSICFICKRQYNVQQRINSQITPFKTCGSLCEDKVRFFIELFVTKDLQSPELPGLMSIAEYFSENFADKLQTIATNMRLSQLYAREEMIMNTTNAKLFQHRREYIENLESKLRNERKYHIRNLEESLIHDVTPEEIEKANAYTILDNDTIPKHSDRKAYDSDHYHEATDEDFRDTRSVPSSAVKEGKPGSILIYNNNQSNSRPIPIPCRNGEKCKFLPNCRYFHVPPVVKPQIVPVKTRRYRDKPDKISGGTPGLVGTSISSDDEEFIDYSPISKKIPETNKESKKVPTIFTKQTEVISSELSSDKKTDLPNLLGPSEVTTSPEQQLKIRTNKSSIIIEKDKNFMHTLLGKKQTYTSTNLEKDSSPKKESLTTEDMKSVMEDPLAPSSVRDL